MGYLFIHLKKNIQKLIQ